MLTLKVLGALGGFLFSLLVARRFGDAALGRAELFVLMITVGATLFRGGMEGAVVKLFGAWSSACLLYTSPSPRDGLLSRMPSSA